MGHGKNEVCVYASQNFHMEVQSTTTNRLINILMERPLRKAGGSRHRVSESELS